MDRDSRNLTVLTLGISTAILGVVFPIMSGHIFRNGAPTALAAFIIIKGASSLRCSVSDVVLSAATLAAVLLSKIVPARIVPPELFQVTAVVLVVIFLMIGLTLRAIARQRKNRNESAG
jgi:hypothetical protein